MDLKYLGRIAVTIIFLLLILGVLYNFVYLSYKWEFTGFVADSDGDPAIDVEVTLINKKGKSISTKTDENGFYRFSSNILKQIPTGVYEINISQELPNRKPYVGYSGGIIQLTGEDIKKDILWTRSDEQISAEMRTVGRYEGGLKFLVYQVKPTEGAEGGSIGSGVYWVRVDLTGLGDEYGIQIENAPGDNVSSSLMKGDSVLRKIRDIKDSTVVDIDSRAKGRYPKFWNAVVFADLESAKLREGVYRLTAKQGEVIFAMITTGVFAENVYDKEGNWVGRTNYSDMTIMSQGYLDKYFEIVNIETGSGEERLRFRCKDNEDVWKKYRNVCIMTDYCDNRIAFKYGCECAH